MNYESIIGQQKDFIISQNDIYIPRKAEEQIKNLLQNTHIKVIIGPRRCGKSTICYHVIKDMNFSYFNFDDSRISRNDFDEDSFLLSLTKNNPEVIFFDEIQNMPKRELFVNRLHKEGYNLLITGSNANLLSMELSTHLTGRHFQIPVSTLSFQELVSYYKIDTSTYQGKKDAINLFDKVMNIGGYPEIYTKNFDANMYTNSLIQDTVNKDILFRYNVRNPGVIDDILLYMYSAITKEYSYNNISKYISAISQNTIQKYIGYLENTFLISNLSYYSHSLGQRSRYNKKIYTIDNGLLSYNIYSHSFDFGKKLENMVFQYLVGIYKHVFYYQDANSKKECDFIIKEGLSITKCIQVCYELNNDNISREIAGLQSAMQKFDCSVGVIITYNQNSFPSEVFPNISIVPAYIYIS